MASANSLIARAFASEHPAALSCEFESLANFSAFRFPSQICLTRSIIVAAAFVESCCESIDDASEEKFDSFFLFPETEFAAPKVQ